MDLIGDGKRCEDVCKHAPPEKGKWPCEDCDMRWHDRAEPPEEEKGGSQVNKDCFNFSCPAYEAQCPCVACPNRTLSEFTITSNRTLTDREISAILAKMQNKEEER